MYNDYNGPRTHNHLVRKWTLNHLAKLVYGFLWIPIYQNNNVGLEKVTAQNIACWWY